MIVLHIRSRLLVLASPALLALPASGSDGSGVAALSVQRVALRKATHDILAYKAYMALKWPVRPCTPL